MACLVVCSESQDLNVDEGLSYNHHTSCCDISGFWNCIVYLFAEKFPTAKTPAFFNQPEAFILGIDFSAFSVDLTQRLGK